MSLHDLAATLPPLYASEFDQDPLARLAFRKGDATYYAVEYDPDEQVFFGLLATDTSRDVASWTLDDLERSTPVEGFTPTPISRCLGHDALAFDELAEGMNVRWRGRDASVKKLLSSHPDRSRHTVKLLAGPCLHELSRRQYGLQPCRRAP